MASTKQLEKSQETVVQFSKHKTFREESGDCCAISRAQKTIKEESGDCGAQGEHGKFEFNPQGEDRTLEFGAQKHRILNLIF